MVIYENEFKTKGRKRWEEAGKAGASLSPSIIPRALFSLSPASLGHKEASAEKKGDVLSPST